MPTEDNTAGHKDLAEVGEEQLLEPISRDGFKETSSDFYDNSDTHTYIESALYSQKVHRYAS